MKLLRFVLPASIPVILLATGHAITACGGSSATTNPTGGDSGTNSGGQDATMTTTTGVNSSTPTSTGNDSGGSTGMDSGSTVVTDAGGTTDAGSLGTYVPGEAGVLTCGGGPCEVATNTCCVYTDGGSTCVSGATATCPQATLHCAQAADCTDNQVCCATFDLVGETLSTACSDAPCPSPGAQPCALGTSECGDAGACTLQNCNGANLQLCGLFSFSVAGFSVACTAE